MSRRIRQTGAARGARGGKSGQSNYFVGFKKHSLYGIVRHETRFYALPLATQVHPANLNDVELLTPLVVQARRELEGLWPVRLVIGDKGYISGAEAALLRVSEQVGVVVRPRHDMNPPAGCDEQGQPQCPAGHALQWEDYDPRDGTLIYRGAPDRCGRCPLSGTCVRQFEFNAGENEIFWGMIPSHSRLCRELLRMFRPRIEQGFGLAKNQYGLKNFFLNNLELAQMVCAMSDVVETARFLAQQRPQHGREMKKTLHRDLFAPEFWEDFNS